MSKCLNYPEGEHLLDMETNLILQRLQLSVRLQLYILAVQFLIKNKLEENHLLAVEIKYLINHTLSPNYKKCQGQDR